MPIEEAPIKNRFEIRLKDERAYYAVRELLTHYNYISFNLKIRHIEKGILHSVNLNEMIPNFHVNRTWFYNTNYTLFFEKYKQIFILHTQ